MEIDWEKYHLVGLLIALVTFSILIAVRRILIRKMTKAFNVRGEIDESKAPHFILILLKRTKKLYLFFAALYLGFLEYDASPKVVSIVDKSFMVVSLWQVVIWGQHFIEFSSRKFFHRNRDGSEEAAINLFSFIAKLSLYVFVFLLLLHNLNVNVTTLITGLGVGGIAIALAVQNILGDLFASMTIVLDKPFVVGDSINVDSFNGTVEHIGMKTTRLRSVDGEQLIFSNSDLLKSRIKNFKRMNERRASFMIGVTYTSSKDKLRRIPQIIKAAIESQPQARFDRSHFVKFADSSLNFETVYWILDRDYTIYRDTHQAVCFEIYEQFAKEGIEFAYPTQTVYQYNVESKSAEEET